MPDSKMPFQKYSFRSQGLSTVFKRSNSRPSLNVEDTLFRVAPEVMQRMHNSLRNDPWEILGVTAGIGALIGFQLGKN